jgi:hypothetical protein
MSTHGLGVSSTKSVEFSCFVSEPPEQDLAWAKAIALIQVKTLQEASRTFA